MKKRGNDDVKDEACIYDESKVKEIHDIIFSIKIDLDLDLDLKRTLGDGNRSRERMEGERESLYEPLMMSSSLKSKPFNSNQKFPQILGQSLPHEFERGRPVEKMKGWCCVFVQALPRRAR